MTDEETIEAIRQEFEDWASREFYSDFVDISENRYGPSYRNFAHHMAWYAYKAAKGVE